MGYYTNYSLEIKRTDGVEGCGHAAPQGAKFCPECGRNLAEPFSVNQPVINYANSIMEYHIEDALNNDAGDWKWYEHEDDMRKISNAFAGYLFVLSGEGEEPGDIWKKYFLNGKCQDERAKIAIAEFDESKLQ